MNRLTFNSDQIRQLKANFHVASLSDHTIQYKGEFKIHAVRENLDSKRPIQIFEESGIDLDMIGKLTPNGVLKRWRKTYRIYGEEGLLNERREKSNLRGRPKKGDSVKRRLAKAEAQIKYLTAENELLKKLEALEREAKYRN